MQVFVEHAHNSEVWDVEAGRYIDFDAGDAVMTTGHCQPKVMRAVQHQADRFNRICHQVLPYESYVHLAERHNDTAPFPFALADQADRASIAAGVFNMIPAGDCASVGRELCSNHEVATITFNGSTRVAKILMRQCANKITEVSLKLWRYSPSIFFDVADTDAAAEGAMIARLQNNVRTCICADHFNGQTVVCENFAAQQATKVVGPTVGNYARSARTLARAR